MIKTITGGFNQFGGDGGFNVVGANGGFSSNNGIITYDPDAQAWFDAMDVQMNSALKAIYNAFVVGCKADVSLRGNTSNWDEIKALWVLMGPTRQASYLNGKYPSLTPISDVVQPQFVPFQGIQGTGTEYVNLNWNPTTALDTWTQNDSGIFVYCETNIAGAMIGMGAAAASTNGSSINPRTATSIMQGRSTGANTNIGSAGTTTDSSGFKSIRRDNATQIKINKGLVSDSFTSTSASAALVNLSLFGLCLNNNGTPGSFDTRQYSFMGTTSGYIDSYKLSLRIETFRS